MSMQMKHNIVNVRITARWSKHQPEDVPYPVIDIEFEERLDEYNGRKIGPVTRTEMITLFLAGKSAPGLTITDITGFNPIYTYSEDSKEGVPDDMVLVLKEYVDPEIKLPEEVKELTN